MWQVPLSSEGFCLCVAVRSCLLPIYCELEQQRTSLWSAKNAEKTWESTSKSWTSQPKSQLWHPHLWNSTVEISTRPLEESRWITFLAPQFCGCSVSLVFDALFLKWISLFWNKISAYSWLAFYWGPQTRPNFSDHVCFELADSKELLSWLSITPAPNAFGRISFQDAAFIRLHMGKQRTGVTAGFSSNQEHPDGPIIWLKTKTSVLGWNEKLHPSGGLSGSTWVLLQHFLALKKQGLFCLFLQQCVVV